MPVISEAIGTEPPESSLISSRPAPVRAGMPRKNEKRVALSRSKSRRRPAVIVAPERETPGNSEMIWTRPTKTASRALAWLSPRCWVATRSANHMTNDQPIAPMATTQRLKILSTTLDSSRPAMRMGMVPMMTYQPKR